MNKFLITFFFSIITIYSFSQQLKGTVKDPAGKPVAFTFVKVKNQALGTKTDAYGNYSIKFPQAGTYEVVFSNLNYKTVEIKITVDEGQELEENITIEAEAKKVKGAVIRGIKNKESEQATMLEQKQSTIIVEKMGAQEMSRKGASDAAAAVTKMAGISKEEGSSQIFIRGLGDRYNTTTLNGMFLPSDNPEFKNISLEYFPIEIIQSIGVSKTYNNTLLGDFGGASIDISTKEYYGKPFVQLGVKTGFNTNAISNDNYGSGVGLLGNYSQTERPNVSEGEFLERNWNPEKRDMPRLNNEINVNGGWSKAFTDNLKLSIFGTATISNKFQYFRGIQKILYSEGGEKESFEKISNIYSTNQNGMLNLVLSTSPKFKTKLNFLGFRTVGNQVNEYNGFDNGINDSIERRRMIQDINNLYVIQSINEYKPNDRLSIVGSCAFNQIENNQPNRLTTSMIRNNGIYTFLANNSGDHSSYYQKLNDNDYSLTLNTKYKLKTDSTNGKDKLNINIGYTYRFKDRAFEQVDYVYRPKPSLNGTYNLSNIDDAFSRENYQYGNFTLEDENPRNSIIDINRYTGDMTIHSPSLGIDYLPSESIVLNFGMRMDLIDQNVIWRIITTNPISGNVNYNDFKILPFINAKYIINESNQVKMAFSKTYTIPQFKELAPFLYYDISTFNARGNPYLYASDNYNLDLKYEKFINKTDYFSIGGFGKFIQNPINKVFEASSGVDQTIYVNSGEQAIVLGTELEIKKQLIDQISNSTDSTLKHALSAGFNISALYSRQDLNKDKIARENNGYTSSVFTFTQSAIQGASPLIFNVDITYRIKYRNLQPQASLIFNYFQDRLFALGAQGGGNVYERGIPSLDLILKQNINQKINLSMSIKNLLNPSINRYQDVPNVGEITVSSFKKGVDFSIGANFNF